MRLLISTLFILMSWCANAQSLELQSIGTAGTYESASVGSLSTTIGEAITTTFSQPAITLTQGFQQPLLEELGIPVYIAQQNVYVNLYPNPTADLINLTIIPARNYKFKIFNVLGQEIDVTNNATVAQAAQTVSFDISGLACASYFLTILNNNQIIKTLKFVKTQ